MLDPQDYFDFDTAYRGASISMNQFLRIVNNSKAYKKNIINGYLKRLKETEPPYEPGISGSLKHKTEIKKQNWVGGSDYIAVHSGGFWYNIPQIYRYISAILRLIYSYIPATIYHKKRYV